MKDLPLIRSVPPQPVDLAGILPAGDAFGLDQIHAEHHRLRNGIPVYWVKMGNNGLHKLEFIYPAGHAYQTKSLTASFTNQLLKEGTRLHTAAEIAEILDHYGASLSPDTDKDRATVSLYTQSDFLPSLVPLMAEILLSPAFDEAEFELLRTNKRQQFLVDLQRVSYLAGRKLQELLYGVHHPYGKVPSLEDYDRLTLQDIWDYYQDHYQPGRMIILVAGPGHDALLPMLDEAFGKQQVRLDGSAPTHLPFAPLPAGESFTVEKPDAVQNALRLACRCVGPGHEDFIPLKVLVTILGGYFGSRLMRNIREEKGYTYGIGATLIPYEQVTAFIIYAEVGSQVSKPAMEAIVDEVGQLQAEPIPEEELRLVKNYMIGSFMRSIDGTFEVAARFRDMLYFRLPEEYYRKYIETIQQITPDRLRVLAGRYLDPGALVSLTAGKN